MRKALALALGLALGANALWMLVAPTAWYLAIPGVIHTGPANLHFIRDIGCAYLVTGMALVWLVRSPRQAWPAALAGGTFLLLHALVHLWGATAKLETLRGLESELPTIFFPAILAVWLALSERRVQ